jgi:predicted NUDIX family phosphoesterase/uridine kinase
MQSDIDQTVRDLEQRAANILPALRFAHRAFVIEFAGTPKSGKSTSVEAVRHFFSRNGFRVHVLTERAATCPIPMKGHLFFNTWCACTMLAELLANVEADADIILVDRGLFDALVWMTMQERRGEIASEEAAMIEGFLLLERWRKLTDLVVTMNVSADEALERENSQRITFRPGSVMNHEVLSAIAKAVEIAFEKYHQRFGSAIRQETTGQTVRGSNTELVANIMDRLEPFLDPDILVVPKAKLDELPMENNGCFTPAARDAATALISEHGRYMRRSAAEVDNEYVQVIPSGVLTFDDKVFIFRRKEADSKYRLYGKTTLLKATHVCSGENEDSFGVLENSLRERISRDLFVSRKFPIHLLGYCWDRNEENSQRHFAMVYEVEINSVHTAMDLKKKEFRSWRGPSVAGELFPWEELQSLRDDINLEPWSQAILRGKMPELGTVAQ